MAHEIEIDSEADLGRTTFEAEDLYKQRTPITKPPAPRLQSRRASMQETPWTIKDSFNVETKDVVQRCIHTLIPTVNFFDVVDDRPDLYGPFWITTTVIQALFFSNSITEYARYATGHGTSGYSIKKLISAASIIYGYTTIIAVLLWGILVWNKCNPKLLDCLCLYGYANIVWLPVSLATPPFGLLSTLASHIVKYVLTGIGLLISIVFLTRNLYPICQQAGSNLCKLLLFGIIVFHCLLALSLQLIFFS
ncbi:Protein YIP5 [Schizosaccharomyces pombe]|uniref:Protein YIP5 n=1 Tax=Schizosaccharomyces pombe (strain 972 / ATCC 24843) TaxID=284812 RepID=YIP5_SCHPO|nr:putative Rab GTPase-binding protein [Schizosaccharomyces pombe]Q9UTD3.1 RecName: Full=Protein YIP5; AltName: Full=YPT-interacting protein 5 [Schizosaccharomyces pombe 972h-]CAB61455.1 Rab GTPase binding (predicted) [Schizosaccharomyces pombe]|eukprot:NP_592960.1 putative Rab GTPase-binding protein [Schizosaccharomyces pombe]